MEEEGTGEVCKDHLLSKEDEQKKSPRQLKGNTFVSPKRSQERRAVYFPQEVRKQFLFTTKCSVRFSVWEMAVNPLW